MAVYATDADYRAIVSSTTDVDEAPQTITLAIEVASELIEFRLGRVFERYSRARKLTASGSCDLLVPDLLEITTITEDGDALSADDYAYEPELAEDRHEPYTSLRRIDDYWTAGYRKIEITGVWGWPSIPVAIKFGAVKIASLLLVDGALSLGTATRLGRAQVDVTPGARTILDDLYMQYRAPWAHWYPYGGRGIGA